MKTREFWKRWLLHSAVVWMAVNLLAVAVYLYYSLGLGITIQNDSLLRRLVGLNITQATPLLILSILLLIELNARLFYQKNLIVFVGSSLLTAAMCCGMLVLSYALLHDTDLHPPIVEPFWLMAAYGFLYPAALELVRRRIFRTEYLYEQSRAELQAIRAQIHPHFLFNTLNGLYGQALSEQAGTTAAGIEKLSGLMRYLLQEGIADRVPVQQEIRFLEEYIALQRMRLPEEINRHVSIGISCDNEGVFIAPLLLLPFVENAFQHGLSINHHSYLRLQLEIRQNRLTMALQNSYLPVKGGMGTGIRNAQKRLELLYPHKHRLDMQQTSTAYTVQLVIELQ